MARSPVLKIYRNGGYVASCKYYEDAAAMMAVSGIGQVKWDHVWVIWHEGREEFPAGDSYDGAADIMRGRVLANQHLAYDKAKSTGGN